MKIISYLIFCILLIAPINADTITIAKDGSGDFLTIQEGIDHSHDGDVIIVHPGTYSESVYFNGVAATLTSTNPDDLSTVEASIISASSDYSVNFTFNEASDSILTGFTIAGKGIYCQESSPTIKQNIIRNCDTAGIEGGLQATPTITENTFKDNLNYCIFLCRGSITKNLLTKNTNHCLYYCGGIIEKNRIVSNYFPYSKAALYDCGGEIKNNIISGNSGEAISRCRGYILNNTIVGNKSYGVYFNDIPKSFRNNIIVSNEVGIYASYENRYNNIWGNNTDYSYSVPGEGDIRRNPLFIRDGYWDNNGTPSNTSDDFWVDGDYHLQSEAGRWDSSLQTWIQDDWTSPCIDAGDPAGSIGIELNPNGARINMGAYGGTDQASKAVSGLIKPVCAYPPKMDFNDDCKVDLQDFAVFCEEWLENGIDLPVQLGQFIAGVSTAIHSYTIDHNGSLPGAGTVSFVEALTGMTDINGNTGSDLGPYLSAIPYNPFLNLNTVDVDGTTGDGSHGWHFDSITGVFQADHNVLLGEIIFTLDKIRDAIENYKKDHHDLPPELYNFHPQMTLYTDRWGNTSSTYNMAAGFIYGPYFQRIPINPLNQSSAVAAADAVGVGWVYDQITGDIYVSIAELDPAYADADLVQQLINAGAAF